MHVATRIKLFESWLHLQPIDGSTSGELTKLSHWLVMVGELKRVAVGRGHVLSACEVTPEAKGLRGGSYRDSGRIQDYTYNINQLFHFNRAAYNTTSDMPNTK